MGSHEQDFNNQALAPDHAERTRVVNDNYETPAVICKDDDYITPFVYNVNLKKNHEYECPSVVAEPVNSKRAVGGHRRKNNQLYGQTTDQRIRFPDSPSSPNAESSPLVVTANQEYKKSLTQTCDVKLVLLFILVLCLSVGGLVLGLMNMLSKENCLCSSRGMA